jgi:hypothetical protein
MFFSRTGGVRCRMLYCCLPPDKANKASCSTSCALSPARSPSSAFCLHTLCLPTESLLVSLFAPLTLSAHAYNFPALSVCRYSGHPRCYLPPLLRAASFFSGLPGSASANCNITSLAVDPALKLVRTSSPMPMCLLSAHCPNLTPSSYQVAAASGPRLAVWSLSGVSARTWLVHSSLVLPDDKAHHRRRLQFRSAFFALFHLLTITHPMQVSWWLRLSRHCLFTL